MQGGDANLASVVQPISTVKIKNQARIAQSVSVTRELATDLPEGVIGSAGLMAATGEVQWAPRTVVSRSADTPWTPVGLIPPVTGDPVSIDIGMDDQQWRQITGYVDTSQGSVSEGSVRTTVVDGIDQLRQTMTLWPLLADMVPVSPWVPQTIKKAGLTACSIVDRVLRRCGFSSTPRPSSDSIFSVSLLGDLHPDLGGELYSCPSTAPAWEQTTWGPCVKRTGEIVWNITDERLTQNNFGFDFGFQMPPTDTRSGDVFIRVAGKQFLRVWLRTGTAGVDYLDSTSTIRTLSIPRRGNRVSLRLKVTNWTATIQVWVDDAQVGTTTTWVAPTLSANTTGEWKIAVSGTLPIAGITMDPIRSDPVPVFGSQTRNMVWDVDTLEPLLASPARVRVEGLSIVREAAQSLCASVWIDEFGAVHWRSRGRVGKDAPAVTLTAEDSIIDMLWISNSAALRREVSVSWSLPAITAQTVPGVTLWQASDIITEAEPETQLFIHPNSGEDWLGIDTTIKFLSGTPAISLEDVERGVGTFGYAEVIEGGYGRVFSSLELLDPQTLLFKAHNEVNPSRISWQTTDEFPVEQYRSQSTPYLRGRAKVQWTEVTTASPNKGPVQAADFTHGAGVWIQTEATALALANWLATFTQTAEPRIESLSIMPDPRVQLGDVVRIVDPEIMHLEFTALVVGIAIAQNGVELTQSLTLRVMSKTVPIPLLGDHDTVWRGAELYEHDVYWTPGDLADLDRNPLRSN